MSKAIEIKNLNYTYPDSTPALRDINLSIDHGERVVIIGPNGAGKSTLLLAIGCFIRTCGSVSVNGIENKSKNIKEIRRVIGAVFQNPDEQLFMPRLIDDIAFGPLNMGLSPEEALDAAKAALEQVGLTGFENKEPHHLSAGQKRAAAVASILSMSPSIITMDEPDSNLDPAGRRNLVKLLNGLDKTIIIAGCSMGFLSQIAERAVLIDGGGVVADGDVKEIMSDSNLMESHGLEVPSNFK
ncbi:Cobalt import ATP-binding protein CbiO [Limihaloglobus sulfuriphilus]|uniref:Cobalt import ATP-binding protein CbiO n=1 Tax=Limihaloglobus sulfuriphilus TaxID=1851148 RepID=A0A1Q2MB02_9BACT|nr:energy-coupling factor ABC transporter ATP-binding protein [Limihaloglobus sulfuriphilus]AQQ69866.1 Cobalt import ATP-binding protein CbiO [Limihaloglobus sulfuriphilus]